MRALDCVDATFGAGTLAALVGANGSGKSTLLRIVAGILRPDEGRVEVNRSSARGVADVRATNFGYAEQHPALDPEMTGIETMRLFHALRGLPSEGRAECIASVVETFELGAFVSRTVGTYSGGQRQRLHLALECMHASTILLLDEPTSSLDPAGRRAIWTRLRSWCADGGTCLIVTHDLAEVEAHADRVIVMHGGRVVADDAPLAIVAAHGRARTTIALAEAPVDPDGLRSKLESVVERGRVSIDGSIVTIVRREALRTPDPAIMRLTERGIAFTRFEAAPPDLAGAFFELTGASTSSGPGIGAGRGAGGGTGRRSGRGGR